EDLPRQGDLRPAAPVRERGALPVRQRAAGDRRGAVHGGVGRQGVAAPGRRGEVRKRGGRGSGGGLRGRDGGAEGLERLEDQHAAQKPLQQRQRQAAPQVRDLRATQVPLVHAV